ncbi:hypothetical protein DV737_g4683, partial [Chaetothyriales sp. CBS 132003]
MTELNLSPSLILSANIANKVAIITGGASGVGAQIVRLLSACGAHPWFCDVDTLAGEALVASTPNAHFIYADATDWEAMYEFFRDVHTVSVLLPPVFSTFDTTLTSAIYAAKLALYFFRHNVTTPTSGGLVGLMRSLSALSPSQHRLSHFHVGAVAVASGTTVTETPTPTTSIGMFTPTPTFSQHLPSHSIIDAQLASSVAMALVVMASNPAMDGKSWVVMDGRRCVEAVD